MIRGGGGLWVFLFFFLKIVQQRVMKKIVCSANCKKKKGLFTKLEEKWGYMGEKHLLVPLPERKKRKFVSG